MEQIKFLDPLFRVEAEKMAWGYGLKTAMADDSKKDEFGRNIPNLYVTDIDNGEYLQVRGVDFGMKGVKTLLTHLASEDYAVIDIRLDGVAGESVGIVSVAPTGGKQQFVTVKTKLSRRVSGIHDLYFVFSGVGKDLLNFDWWKTK